MTGDNSLLVYLAVMILAVGGILFVYGFQSRRAIFKVLEIFSHHQAFRASEAKSLRELGLERPDFVQRMMRPRDYKQYALQILIKQGIVSVTDDGKFYLVEDRLEKSLRQKVSELRARGGRSEQ